MIEIDPKDINSILWEANRHLGQLADTGAEVEWLLSMPETGLVLINGRKSNSTGTGNRLRITYKYRREYRLRKDVILDENFSLEGATNSESLPIFVSYALLALETAANLRRNHAVGRLSDFLEEIRKDRLRETT